MHLDYTKALLDLVHEGVPIDSVLAAVEKVMIDRGHGRVYGKVLRNALRVLSSRNEYAGAFVTVAHEDDVTTHARAINTALKKLGVTSTYEVTVDTTMIGGYAVHANNLVIDATYKKALLDLYRTIAA